MLPLIITVVATLMTINSKQLSYNLNYNGPFNTKQQPSLRDRRLLDIDTSSSSQNVSFYHGVASGDPSDVDVLLWTRVTPPYQDEYGIDISIANLTKLSNLKTRYATIPLKYAIAISEDLINFDCEDAFCGIIDTNVNIDYTVKVRVDDLTPNTWYYYQFKVASTKSPIGRTRTLPAPNQNVDNIRFAFGSCKQWAHGFFNNLGDIAVRDDLDYMVWLGDYIYEFPNDALVNGSAIDRIPFPPNYLYNLSHYRGRYMQHHLDENIQAAHHRLPWLMLWDDHEVVNDYWFDGAPERWQDDGKFGVNFMERKANGYQAFFEWTPVRTVDTNVNGGLYNSYSFGNLFDLILIDAASQRTQPAVNVTEGAKLSANIHYSFGEIQRNWIINKLNESQTKGTKWRLIGSNNPFGQSPPRNVFGGTDFLGAGYLAGYDKERQIILDAINNNNLNNVMSLSGGPHTGIAHKIYSTGKPLKNNSDSYPLFTEFVVDALSAPKLFEEVKYLPYIENYAAEWFWVSPYFRLLVDGYCIMDIDKERGKVEYWINNNTKDANSKSVLDATLCVYDDRVEFDDCDTISTSQEPIIEEGSDKMGVIIGCVIGTVLAVGIISVFAAVAYSARKDQYANVVQTSDARAHHAV